MPKLLSLPNMDTGSIPGLSGYQFSAVRTDRLGASEYTLVTIAVDISTSVQTFEAELVEALKMTVSGLRSSARADNLLLRVVMFNQAVSEVHGFRPVLDIDVQADYAAIKARGTTALYDAAASSVGAITEYGRILTRQDYGVNGILYVITDGEDVCSTYTPDTVRQNVEAALSNEALESFVSVLIGINAQRCRDKLEFFVREAGLTEYVDIEDATARGLAKMAGVISRSVSSQASQLGSGQPAQLPALVI